MSVTQHPSAASWSCLEHSCSKQLPELLFLSIRVFCEDDQVMIFSPSLPTGMQLHSFHGATVRCNLIRASLILLRLNSWWTPSVKLWVGVPWCISTLDPLWVRRCGQDLFILPCSFVFMSFSLMILKSKNDPCCHNCFVCFFLSITGPSSTRQKLGKVLQPSDRTWDRSTAGHTGNCWSPSRHLLCVASSDC